MRAALSAELERFGDLGEIDERELIQSGIVEDQLTEYKQRCPRNELSEHQIIGPRPIPTTLEEARPWLTG